MSTKKSLFQRQKSDLSQVPSSAKSQSASKSSKSWKAYVKLKELSLEENADNNKFHNQYDTILSLLDRIEGLANMSPVLKETCAVVVSLVGKMKDELPAHRDILKEKTAEDEFAEEVDEEEKNKQDILSRLDLERQDSNEARRSSDESAIKVDKFHVIRTYPTIESGLYSLLRKLRLLIPGEGEDALPFQFMGVLVGIQLVEELATKLRNLVAPLEEVELTQSKNEANISDSVILKDQRRCVLDVVKVLEEMQEGLAEELEISYYVTKLLDKISSAQEEAEKASDILRSIKGDLENILEPIAESCDATLADKEIAWTQGPLQYTEELGDVFQGFLPPDEDANAKVILSKVVSLRKHLGIASRRELQIEVTVLHNLRHDNLTDFLFSAFQDGELCLNWDFHNRSLYMCLFHEPTKAKLKDERNELTNEVVMKYAIDILKALDFLHMNGVMHKAITSKNVLISNDMSSAKLGDFCFVAGKREAEGSHVDPADRLLALTYRAPETMRHSYSQRPPKAMFTSDVYSFGVVLYEMIEKKKAFGDLSKDALHKRLFKSTPKRPNFSEASLTSVPKFVQGIVHRCWQQKPWLRPSPGAVLEELKFQMEPKVEPEEGEEAEEQEEKFPRSESFLNWLPAISGVEEE